MKEYIVPCDDDVSEFESMRGNTELIRCKDCQWHYGSLCRKTNTMPWKDDDFCSKAEREEE